MQNLLNPDNPNFWDALSTIVAICTAIGGFLGWLITKWANNTVSKTTKIMIYSIVEQYLDWVKIYSKSQEVSKITILEWLTQDGGSIKTGRSFLVFRKFIQELEKRSYKNVSGIDCEVYLQKVRESDSGTKWGRKEW